MKSRRDRASSANSKSCAAESFTLAGDTGGLSTKTPGSVVSCVLPTVEKLAATSVATNIPIRIIHPPLGGHSYPAKRRAVQHIRMRLEERRVGKECVSRCRSRGSRYQK